MSKKELMGAIAKLEKVNDPFLVTFCIYSRLVKFILSLPSLYTRSIVQFFSCLNAVA